MRVPSHYFRVLSYIMSRGCHKGSAKGRKPQTQRLPIQIYPRAYVHLELKKDENRAMLPNGAWTPSRTPQLVCAVPLPPEVPKLCFRVTLNRPFSFSEQYSSLLSIREHRRILSCHFWGVCAGRVQTRRACCRAPDRPDSIRPRNCSKQTGPLQKKEYQEKISLVISHMAEKRKERNAAPWGSLGYQHSLPGLSFKDEKKRKKS